MAKTTKPKQTRKYVVEKVQPQESLAITNTLLMIERVANNSDVDPDKMKALLDMQERIMAKQSEMAFNQAMARLQPRIPVIKHDALLEHKGVKISTYARFETIDKAIRSLYTAEGFSVSFNAVKNPNNTTTYVATLAHSEGHFRTASMDLPNDTSGAKNPIQAIGSTISYAKRYLLSMLFNIVTEGEDDDGQEGGDNIPKKATSRFDQRAEAGRTIDAEAEETSGDLSEIGEEQLEWDGRTIHTGKGNVAEKDFENPDAAARYLQKVMQSHKTKAGRVELISINTALIRRLITDKNMQAVGKLHQTADQGE